MNSYSYDAEGKLLSSNGAQYIYDAQGERVEKLGGSNPNEAVYFNGKPLALYNPATGAWTDLIWTGNSILAEVQGTQTSPPTYRLLDQEGSLVATVDSSDNVTATNLLAPYGQALVLNTTDPYLYTGLYQDTEYGGDDAWYRNYSAEQSRWLSPDPYNGSYDLNNPQSLNRYVYVNGNPLAYTDPTGLADGIVNGAGGSPCTASGQTVSFSGGYSFNPCDPVLSGVSDGIFGVMQAFGFAGTASEVAPIVGAAFTIFCSIDTNKTACGPSGWTSVVFGSGSVAGKVVEDSIAAVGAAFGVECAASGPFALANPGCGVVLAYAIYTALNDLFSVFWEQFGPPQFTGSLLPRPSDLGGLGTSPIGIPNQNLNIKGILGQPSSRTVPSPGLKLP